MLLALCTNNKQDPLVFLKIGSPAQTKWHELPSAAPPSLHIPTSDVC